MITVDTYASLDEAKKSLASGHYEICKVEARNCLDSIEEKRIYPDLIDHLRMILRDVGVFISYDDLEMSALYLKVAIGIIENIIEQCEKKGLVE